MSGEGPDVSETNSEPARWSRQRKVQLAVVLTAVLGLIAAMVAVVALRDAPQVDPATVQPTGVGESGASTPASPQPTATPTVPVVVPPSTAGQPTGVGSGVPPGSVVFSSVVGGVGELGYLWGVRVLAPGGSRPAELARTPVDPGLLSPDGRLLAWVAPDSDDPASGLLTLASLPPSGSAVPDYSAADATGTRVVAARVARSPGSSLVWSPDSRRIAFSDDHGRLNSIGVDGSDGRMLSEDVPDLTRGRHSLAWSPDGRQIAVGVLAGLFLVDVDASSRRTTSVPLSEADRFFGNLSWSPDGGTLAAVPADAGPVGGLRLIDPASGSVRLVSDDAFLQSGTAWRDGTTVLAVQFHQASPNGDGYCEIVAVDVTSGAVRSRLSIDENLPGPNPSVVQLQVAPQ